MNFETLENSNVADQSFPDHISSGHRPFAAVITFKLPQLPNQFVRTSKLSVNNPIGAIRVCQHVFSHSGEGEMHEFSFAVENWKQQRQLNEETEENIFFLQFSLQRSFVAYGSKFLTTQVASCVCVSRERKNLSKFMCPEEKIEQKQPISLKIRRFSSPSHSQNRSKRIPFDWTQFVILQFLTAEVLN